MAESRTQGILVAARTRIPCWSLPTPCIWMRNSVLILRADSDSFSDLIEEFFSSKRYLVIVIDIIYYKPSGAEGINLVDKDDGGLVLTG